MSDERQGPCGGHADELAELALGVLTGRERATVLSHTESCPHCRGELEVLSRAADSVVLAAPEVEPPMGFEVRLFEQMGLADKASPSRHRWRSRRMAAAAIAAAVVLGALGAGWALTSSSHSPTLSSVAPGGTTSAALTGNGRIVGHVTIDGAKRWMSMTLADSSVHGTVECVVVTDDGAVHHVGTFVAEAGYGAWIARLRVDPARLRSAEVLSAGGAVIATASLQ